jgi:hypothetical protein
MPEVLWMFQDWPPSVDAMKSLPPTAKQCVTSGQATPKRAGTPAGNDSSVKLVPPLVESPTRPTPLESWPTATHSVVDGQAMAWKPAEGVPEPDDEVERK